MQLWAENGVYRMSASNDWLVWMLGGIASLGTLVYGVFEYLKWLERTQVFQVPTGLVFMAQRFQVETNRTRKHILVRTEWGRYTQAPIENMASQEKSGPLQVTLSALGLRMSVSPVMQEVGKPAGSAQAAAIQVPTGQCTITFDNAEEKVTLVIPKVPAKAGLAFEEFSRQIAVWIEKLEERRAKAEAAAIELTVVTEEPRKMDLGDAEGSAPDEPIFPTEL
jgi:hypothetical protein